MAQIATGGITGTVMDPTGAVVPAAKITLTNDATGVELSTVSTSTGTYALTAVLPGPYTPQAELQGFQRFIGVVGVQGGKVALLEDGQEIRSIAPAVSAATGQIFHYAWTAMAVATGSARKWPVRTGSYGCWEIRLMSIGERPNRPGAQRTNEISNAF